MHGSWRWLVPALALGLCGCPGSPPVSPPVAPPPKVAASASLAELLKKPRSELAAQAEECLDRIRLQEKAHRQGQLPYGLLPDYCLPLVVPVLREARYSAAAGFSLPPYLGEGGHDSDLALHLARHGDLEAARKLVAPGDAETLRQIEACAGERNYPVEWTRLVGLLLHEAQVGIAMNNQDHAADLVGWHEELTRLLDTKTAKGPLGTALLARGREVLTLAAATWQKDNHTALADRVRQAAAAWGAVPAPLPLPLGAARADVVRLLRPAQESGRVLVAGSMLRALDLLNLPFPADDAESVLAFLDEAGRLAEVQIAYRSKTTDHYQDLEDLALLWEEQLGVRPPAVDQPGLQRRTYRHEGQASEVILAARSSAAGGLVRCWMTDAVPGAPPLPRDFQTVSLDRSFEQNRLQVNPVQRGDAVFSERAQTLAGVKNPLPALRLQRVTVQHAAGQEPTSRLVLAYQVEPLSLAEVALPLWALWGPGRVEGVSDDQGGHLALIWEDGKTRSSLCFPYQDTEPVTFVVEDQPGGDPATRPGQVQTQDRAERLARIKAGKTLTRLPRRLDWDVSLGATRDEALQALPSESRTILKRDIADGFVFTFAAEPAKSATLVVRQLVLRFDAAGRLGEMRAWYEIGPAGKNFKELVAGLQKKGGAPAESPGPWAALWRGLPEKKPAPLLSTWQDDLTVMTCQTDAASAEVVLRDWPADRETPLSLPPLQVLPRGPEGCPLGAGRDELLSRWMIKKPEVVDGAVVLRPAAGGRYDVLLVYCDGGRVSRVLARHALPAKQAPTQPAQMATALTEAWGRDLMTLGWPRRQDVNDKNQLTGLGWHDDTTQVWTFWQEAGQGPPRVYTEWKDVPLAR